MSDDMKWVPVFKVVDPARSYFAVATVDGESLVWWHFNTFDHARAFVESVPDPSRFQIVEFERGPA